MSVTAEQLAEWRIITETWHEVSNKDAWEIGSEALPDLLDEVERLRAREAKVQALVEAAENMLADHLNGGLLGGTADRLRAALDALKEGT